MKVNFRTVYAFPEPHIVLDVFNVRLIAALVCVEMNIKNTFHSNKK